MPNNRDLHPDIQRWLADQKQLFEQVTRDMPRIESMAELRAELDTLKAERDRGCPLGEAPQDVPGQLVPEDLR